MAMSNEGVPEIDRLRNNIEFASVSQFFHTFQSAFRPWPTADRHSSPYPQLLQSRKNKEEDEDYEFATEDLERMILEVSERPRFEELLVRMLRLLTRNRFINNQTWQMYFARELKKREPNEPNPFYPVKSEEDDGGINEHEKTPEPGNEKPEQLELINYFTLPLETRVHLLYILCEWQLDDAERFREHLDNEADAVHWRVEPIGFDAKGSSFWLFDDNRLYKETPEPKPKKKTSARKSRARATGTRRSTRQARAAEAAEQEQEEEEEEEWVPWKLICLTSSDWEKLPQKYEKSKHPDEQRFYNLLVNDVIPKVLPVLREHEEAMRKKEAIMNRKRSSRLISRELEALERDQQFNIMMETRRSARREEMARKRGEEAKKAAANAREERLRERERRIQEREQEREEQERRRAIAESKMEAKKAQVAAKTAGKKRGRKPKSHREEDVWNFDCVCGVSGQNIDDGSPMIACEGCGTWQHIRCLQKAGQIDKQRKSLDNVSFFCRSCIERESQEVDIDGLDDQEEPAPKKQKENGPVQIRLPNINANGHRPAGSAVLPPPPTMNYHPVPPPIPYPPQPQEQQPQQQQQWRPIQAQGNGAAIPPHLLPLFAQMLAATSGGQNRPEGSLPPILPQPNPVFIQALSAAQRMQAPMVSRPPGVPPAVPPNPIPQTQPQQAQQPPHGGYTFVHHNHSQQQGQ